MTLEHATYQAPTDAALREKRLEFLKDCRPKSLSAMRKAGGLEAHLTGKVAAARSYAENLIEAGMFAGEAWNQAVRLELLESETD